MTNEQGYIFGVRVGPDVAQEYADAEHSQTVLAELGRVIVEGDSKEYYKGLTSGLHTAAGVLSLGFLDDTAVMKLLAILTSRAAKLYLDTAE